MQKRFILRWLLLFLLVCNTFVTLNINIAIVSMVNRQDVEITFNKSQALVCPNATFLSKYYSAEGDEIFSERIFKHTGYDWSKAEQNMVLSGYYWLNYVFIMPGGILAHKYGSKKVLGYAQLISSTMSSLIPITAEYGPFMVSCVRAVQGILSFMSVPAGLFSIIGNWSPPHERGKFLAIIQIGSSTGMMVGNFLFGCIGQYLHWSFIFHLTSVCGIVWSVLWYLLVYDSPFQHPSISTKEKCYIENSLKFSNDKTKTFIPWKDIMTSVPLMVCVLATTSATWSWVTTATYSPVYLKYFYGLNPNEIGIIASVPNFVICVLCFGLAHVTDLVIEKNLLTITTVRKVCSFAGGILSTIPLLVIAFTKCNLFLYISCHWINSVMKSFDVFGISLIVMDLSPKFCGILEGFSSSASSILTFVFSTTVNYFSTVHDTETLWKTVFLCTALYSIFSCGMFLIFGTSKVQNWNFQDDAAEVEPPKESRVNQIEINRI